MLMIKVMLLVKGSDFYVDIFHLCIWPTARTMAPAGACILIIDTDVNYFPILSTKTTAQF